MFPPHPQSLEKTSTFVILGSVTADFDTADFDVVGLDGAGFDLAGLDGLASLAHRLELQTWEGQL